MVSGFHDSLLWLARAAYEKSRRSYPALPWECTKDRDLNAKEEDTIKQYMGCYLALPRYKESFSDYGG